MQILPEMRAAGNVTTGRPRSAAASEPPRHSPRVALAASSDDADRFLETVYRAGQFATSPLALQELLGRSDTDVDFHLDEVTGCVGVQPRSGPRLRYQGGIPGLGRVGRPLLEELMWQPGEMLSVERLLRNPCLRSLASAAVRATRLKSLRRAFHDSDGWFFELARNPWRLRWRPERSWRVIERLALGGYPPDLGHAA